MGRLTHERYEAEFEAETARLGAAVSGQESGARVLTCPEWTVRDLVTHVGTGHRWATTIVGERLAAPPPFPTVAAPEEPAAWPDWLAGGARGLVEAIRQAGPDCPVWTWQADRSAGFWLRRMAHDLLVHRFDAELTGGGPADVAPDLAADGVSDMLDCVTTLSGPGSPAASFRKLAGSGETIQLLATDPGLGAGGAWLVERVPEGARWRHDQVRADVTVRAPARDLLLLVNRRLDPAGPAVAVAGDEALLAYWLEHSRF
jgi:uncharacterized protein (TIGR03083 family)